MAVPTVYSRLIAAWDRQPDATQQAWTAACASVRLIVCGSAALPQPIMERWKEVWMPCAHLYACMHACVHACLRDRRASRPLSPALHTCVHAASLAVYYCFPACICLTPCTRPGPSNPSVLVGLSALPRLRNVPFIVGNRTFILLRAAVFPLISCSPRCLQVSGHDLLERYGMTEIGMGLSNPLHGVRRPGFVGLPLPGVTAKIHNDDCPADSIVDSRSSVLAGVQVPPLPSSVAVEGELRIKGLAVFSEYAPLHPCPCSCTSVPLHLCPCPCPLRPCTSVPLRPAPLPLRPAPLPFTPVVNRPSAN